MHYRIARKRELLYNIKKLKIGTRKVLNKTQNLIKPDGSQMSSLRLIRNTQFQFVKKVECLIKCILICVYAVGTYLYEVKIELDNQKHSVINSSYY